LVCKSIPRVEGESIEKVMIIGHSMKDCSSWKQWSLDTRWNCSSWCQAVLGYLPQTRLLWRPRFLITVINTNDRISWVKPVKPRSNLGQPGSSPENLANEP
jgi:hypothetical protein